MKEQFVVERAISSFHKTSGKLISNASIHLSLGQLKTIFTPYPNDPLMYDSYNITREQAGHLSAMDGAIALETESFDYELECYRNGEWLFDAEITA